MQQALLPFEADLYIAGCFHFVNRAKLRELLGTPVYVEKDGHATYGGEEDWWGLQVSSTEFIGLCLRVPYEDAVVICTKTSKAIAESHYSTLSAHWVYESYADLYSL